MAVELLFAKVIDDAIIPSKRDEDGWYDIYASASALPITIEPHQVKLIPTGIASAFPEGYRIKLSERGSNTKSHLIVQSGCIDSGYRGEWFVALYNGYIKPVTICNGTTDYIETTKDYYGGSLLVPGSKAICQAGLEVVPESEVKEIGYEELKAIKSERGTGCLGSSGK